MAHAPISSLFLLNTNTMTMHAIPENFKGHGGLRIPEKYTLKKPQTKRRPSRRRSGAPPATAPFQPKSKTTMPTRKDRRLTEKRRRKNLRRAAANARTKLRRRRGASYKCHDCDKTAKRWGRLRLIMKGCGECSGDRGRIGARTPENCMVVLRRPEEDGDGDGCVPTEGGEGRRSDGMERPERTVASYGGSVLPPMYTAKSNPERRKRRSLLYRLANSPTEQTQTKTTLLQSLPHQSMASIMAAQGDKLKEKKERRRDRKNRRRFECGECGHGTKKWGQLREYLKRCRKCDVTEFSSEMYDTAA